MYKCLDAPSIIKKQPMTHNPLKCFGRRWFTPLFISGSHAMGKVPSVKELSAEELEFLLYYVYAPHNLDDFRDSVRQHCNSGRCKNLKYLHAASLWSARFSHGQGELVCSPAPGIIAWVFIASIPALIAAAGLFGAYIFGLGLTQLFQ